MKILLVTLLLGGVLAASITAGCAAPTAAPKVKAAVESGTTVPAQRGLLLAQNGKSLQPIVIAATASDTTKAAAKELAEYLGRITGSTVEIKLGDGTSGIVLGTLEQFPTAELKKPLEMRGPYDGVEAYAIRTEPKRLLLLGNTDLGARHAAYRFLETLGVRWFFPGKNWEVVPTRSTLRHSVNESGRPAVLARSVWPGWGLFDEKSQGENEAWNRRNHIGQSYEVPEGHAWEAIIAANKAEFDAHPEYLALAKQPDGSLKRGGAMLELGNPAVRALVVKWALDILRKNPSKTKVSVEPTDGLYENESPESKAYGATPSDQIFGLANEVARAVQREFPGKMVSLYAYSNHSDPPSFDLEPNVFVQLTDGFNYSDKGYTFKELLTLWGKKTRNLGIYTYLAVWQGVTGFDRLPGAPVKQWAELMRRYIASNAVIVSAERSNDWGPRGLGYYVVSKVLWNPDVDVDALLQDFHEKAFGPAAPSMKRYYELIDGEKAQVSGNLIGTAMKHLDEAAKLAKGRPDVQARVYDLKSYLVFVSLRERYDALPAPDQAARKEAALKMYTHVYRTRYSYMEHWRPYTVYLADSLAKEFNEPTWGYGDGKTAKPWEVEPPLSHQEIEAQFQEARKLYPTQGLVGRKTFSTDLVPIKFGEPPAAAPSFWGAGHAAKAHFAVYSKKGEPLLLELETGLYKPSIEDGRYVVTDSTGKTIGEGKITQDANTRQLVVPVPRPGLYFWEIENKGGGTRITMPPAQPLVLLTDKDQLGTVGTPPWSFYVPKGTRTVQFYWSAVDIAGTAQVVSPDNKTVQDVTMPKAQGVLGTISIPEGQDGKVWTIRNLFFGQIDFYNVPAVLALSPAMLMVPREVAIKDGLAIAPEATRASGK